MKNNDKKYLVLFSAQTSDFRCFLSVAHRGICGLTGQGDRQLFYHDGQMCGLWLRFSLLNPNQSNFKKVLPACVF